jgi:very-short-patch-repair endonuclease
MDQSNSELERRWLHFINDRELRLPTHAQKHIEACKTKPDFFYKNNLAVIYVDGPVHEYPKRADRDAQQTDCFEDNGCTVIRFNDQDD